MFLSLRKMAQTQTFLLLLSILPFLSSSSRASPTPPQAIVAPITRDSLTSLHTITLQDHGHFLLDIAGTFLWSSLCPPNHRTVPCSSKTCNLAHAFPSPPCHLPLIPVRHPCACTVTLNSAIPSPCTLADLTVTRLTISTTNGHNPTAPVTTHPFFSSCSSSTVASPLPAGAVGVLGLSRSALALSSQLSISLSIKNQFAICLPSTSNAPGVAFFGEKPFYLLPPPGLDVFTILSYTKLKRNKYNPYYYLNLNSIAVNGAVVPFLARLLEFDSLGHGGVQLSTAVPYTTLRTNIYRPFLDAYSQAIKDVPQAATLPPFDLCVKSSALGSTRVGYGVPQIDLMLANDKNWTVFGANSFKQVAADTACLAFVDGGWKSAPAIVIGAYQMEDNLLLFDVEKSRLGFSSSLLFESTTCSNFNFTLGV